MMKTLIWIIILVIVVISSVFLIAVNQGNSVTGNFLGLKSCKTVSVPYQVTEDYETDFKYEVKSAYHQNILKGFDVWAQSRVTVRNVDTDTGTFTVEQTFDTLKDQPRTFKSSAYVMPDESKVFEAEYNIDSGEDYTVTYSVIPPTKVATRMVTKYKQEKVCS